MRRHDNHNKTEGRKDEEKGGAVGGPTESIDSEDGKIEYATACLRRGGSLLLLGPRWWYISLTRLIMARLPGSIENVLCTTAISASDAQGWDRIGAQRVRTVGDEETFRRLLSIRYAQPNLDLSVLKCRRQASLALRYGAMLGVAVATATGSAPIPIASVSIPIASASTPIAPVSIPIASASTPIAPASIPLPSVEMPAQSLFWEDYDVADMSEDEEVEDGWITKRSNIQQARLAEGPQKEADLPESKTAATPTPTAKPESETHVRIVDHISHLVRQTKDDESLWALFGGGPILCMSRWLAVLCPPLCPPFSSAPSESEHFDFLCQRALSSPSPIIVCEPSTTVISPVTLARFGAVLRFW